MKKVVYPRMPHNTTEPKQKLGLMWRNVEWFDEYLGAGKPSAEIDTQ